MATKRMSGEERRRRGRGEGGRGEEGERERGGGGGERIVSVPAQQEKARSQSMWLLHCGPKPFRNGC